MLTSRQAFLLCLGPVLFVGGSAESYGKTLFLDDFSDGSVLDGTPAVWFPPNGSRPSTMDASSGDLIVSESTGAVVAKASPSRVESGESLNRLSTVSLKTQARLLEPGAVLIAVRDLSHSGVPYTAVIVDNGMAYLGMSSGFATVGGVYKGFQTDFDVMNEDVVMQLDADGHQVELRLWRPNETMPVGPQLSFLSDFSEMGSISVGAINDGDGTPSSAVFRYVQVDVPEPTAAGLLCIGATALIVTRVGRRGVR